MRKDVPVFTLLLICDALALVSSAQTTVLPLAVGHLSLHPRVARMADSEVVAFEAAHTGVEIETVALTQPMRAKEPITEVADLAANVFALDGWSGYEAGLLGAQGRIVPIETFLPDPEFDKAAFYDNLWGPVTVDGKTWGVPFAAETLVLVYDEAMFEAAGISGPPKTWDDVIEYAKKTTCDTNGDGDTDQWGLLFHEGRVFRQLVTTIAMQAGATLFDQNGLKEDQPEVEQAVMLIKKLFAAGIMPPVEIVGWDVPVAMEVTSGRRLEDLTEREHLRVAPLPTLGEHVIAGTGTLYLAVRRSTPEQEKASWELVKWLTRRDIGFPDGVWPMSCRKDFTTRPEFQEWASQYAGDTRLVYESIANIRIPGPYAIEGRGVGFERFWSFVTEATVTQRPLGPWITAGAQQANKMMKLLDVSPAPADVSEDLY